MTKYQAYRNLKNIAALRTVNMATGYGKFLKDLWKVSYYNMIKWT